MKMEVAEFLYKEYVDAIEFCNELSTDMDAELFADPETLNDTFFGDLILLAFFPMCADGDISADELDSFNELAELFSYEIDREMAMRMLREIKDIPFEEPKSLIAFVLRATTQIMEAFEEDKQKTIERELSYLDNIMVAYADLMCAMVDRMTPEVKQSVLNCLGVCCRFVAETLEQPFELSEDVKRAVNESAQYKG